MERTNATKLLRSCLDANGLSHWHIRLLADFNKPFLGMCDYRSQTIILNAFHVDTHPEIEIKETIYHEVAHALCPHHGHDDVWKEKAIQLGCTSPSPCATFGLSAEAIDAIRSGDMLEISYEERVIREPKVKITKLVDKCEVCGKVAKTVKVTEMKLSGKQFRVTRLECGHLIKEEVMPTSDYESFVFDITDANCKHEWDKTVCVKCAAKKLYPFQVEGCKAIERHNGRFAILDEPGLGKTIQFSAWVRFNFAKVAPILHVTKSSAKYQHGREVVRIVGIVPQIINTKWDKPLPGMKYFICSYDIFRRQDLEMWKAAGIKTILLDEVQAIKNPDSTRTQCIRKLIRDKGPMGEVREIPNIIPTSGGFWKNRGSEAFVMLNLLDPKMFYSYEYFKNHEVDYYWEGSKRKEAGLKNPKKFLDRISHIAIRRERAIVMPELPLINRTKFMCELDSVSKEVYSEEETKIKNIFNAAVIDGSEDSFETKKQMHASLMVMRQIIGIAKVPITLELAQEFLEETDRKLVIFVHHKKCGELLMEGMKTWCAENDVPQPLQLTSSLNAEERGKVQDAFNGPNYRLLIASTLSAGEAINLQTCSDSIMHERQWNPDNEEQAEGRFIRIGQTANSVNMTYVHANEIVDTHMDVIVGQKRIWKHTSMNKGDMPQWNESSVMDELIKAILRKR